MPPCRFFWPLRHISIAFATYVSTSVESVPLLYGHCSQKKTQILTMDPRMLCCLVPASESTFPLLSSSVCSLLFHSGECGSVLQGSLAPRVVGHLHRGPPSTRDLPGYLFLILYAMFYIFPKLLRYQWNTSLLSAFGRQR